MPGSLKEVRPGVWKLRMYGGLDSTKHQHQRSVTFKANGKREAGKVAAQHVARFIADAEQVKEARGTVGALVDDWVRHRAKDSPATIYRRQSIVRTIKRDLGRIKVDDLTSLQIDQWLDRLRAENVGQGSTPRYRSESTVHHYFRVLRAIMYQGYQWEMTERTPQKRATKPKVRRHARVNAPPDATVRFLIQSAPPDLAVAAAVLAATGLRRGELAALQWTDVDLEVGVLRVTKSIVGLPGGKLTVKQPKTEESIREVEIDGSTAYLLDQHHRRWATDLPHLAVDAYLFPDPLSRDRTGRTPRSPDWMSRGWRALCKKHGATIRLHDLRHWHLSTLLDRGVPIAAVSARGGHAKTSTTHDIYTHSAAGAGRVAALAIEAALKT